MLLIIISCGSFACVKIKGCNMKTEILEITKELKPLDKTDSSSYPDSVTEFFRFYGLDLADENIDHIFGTFQSQDKLLTAHIFKPKKYKATVFMLHGYFDHCGQLSHLIEYLLSSGFAVATFDLPGHGLSEGQRGDIEDFSQYSAALKDFVNVANKDMHGPYHVIGFSTGASAAIDYLFSNEDDIFEKVVLAAPLVHCVAWEQSKIGYKKNIPFVKSVPRVFRDSSSDDEFIDFIKHKDPLQNKMVPLTWVKALHNWNDRIAELPVCQRKVTVIQGTLDSTVDWEFNVDFLKQHFSDTEVIRIEDGRHELFNESTELRKRIFSKILYCLEN